MFLKLGRHPRLVRFFGQCVDGEDQLMVTEFAKHGSLSDCFEMWEDTITLTHNVAVSQQIAQGMEHLSAEGIIHRDLAARNVLVMSFDEADALKTSVKITAIVVVVVVVIAALARTPAYPGTTVAFARTLASSLTPSKAEEGQRAEGLEETL